MGANLRNMHSRNEKGLPRGAMADPVAGGQGRTGRDVTRNAVVVTVAMVGVIMVTIGTCLLDHPPAIGGVVPNAKIPHGHFTGPGW